MMRLVLALCATFVLSPAFSNEPSRDEAIAGCDRFAADPDDRALGKDLPRVADGIMNFAQAALMCEAAVKLAPANPRFLHQAGRVAFLKQDFGIARAHFEKASAQGYAASKHLLARLQLTPGAYLGAVPASIDAYLAGAPGTLPYGSAVKLLFEAKEAGHPAAAVDLGTLLLSGALVLRDPVAALDQFKLASGQGVLAGDVAAGAFFQSGPSIQRDYGLARAAYEQAAAKGEPRAKQALAIMAERGLGEPVDQKKAGMLKGEAASLGYLEAQPIPEQDLLRLTAAGDGEAAFQLGTHEEKAGRLVQAEKLYRIAGSRGIARGFVAEGRLLKQRGGEPEALFRLAAERGDDEGAQALGDHLVQLGRTQEAEGFLQLAALANMPGARKALAQHYSLGTIGRKSAKNAREWFQKAIEGGDETARLGLAQAVLNEAAESGDYAEARKQFEGLLAGPDKAEAAYQLALMALNGLGQAPDAKRARDLFEIAANAGDTRSMVFLGGLLAGDQLGNRDVDGAKRWYEQAAARADISAMFALASLFAEEVPDPKAEEEAVRWLVRAAHFKMVEARWSLALAKRHGIGTNRDDAEAFRMIGLLAAENDFVGKLNLARAYELGIGVPVDFVKAVELYAGMADNDGTPDAMLGLARIYRKGVTGEPDPVQAYFYAQRAIEAGMDEGYVIASELLMRGEGIAKDEPTARATLEKGAEAGLPRTTLALARLICKTADKGNACAETGARLNELYENEVPGAAEVLAAAIDERLVEAATPGFVKQLRDQLRIEFRRKALTNQITLID
jgi:uncharacterized protein